MASSWWPLSIRRSASRHLFSQVGWRFSNSRQVCRAASAWPRASWASIWGGPARVALHQAAERPQGLLGLAAGNVAQRQIVQSLAKGFVHGEGGFEMLNRLAVAALFHEPFRQGDAVHHGRRPLDAIAQFSQRQPPLPQRFSIHPARQAK